MNAEQLKHIDSGVTREGSIYWVKVGNGWLFLTWEDLLALDTEIDKLRRTHVTSP
jgi:hypothetical protein